MARSRRSQPRRARGLPRSFARGSKDIFYSQNPAPDPSKPHPALHNHENSLEAPPGMNMLYGDGRVTWEVPENGWTRWAEILNTVSAPWGEGYWPTP